MNCISSILACLLVLLSLILVVLLRILVLLLIVSMLLTMPSRSWSSRFSILRLDFKTPNKFSTFFTFVADWDNDIDLRLSSLVGLEFLTKISFSPNEDFDSSMVTCPSGTISCVILSFSLNESLWLDGASLADLFLNLSAFSMQNEERCSTGAGDGDESRLL